MIPKKITEGELAENLVARLPLRPAARGRYGAPPMTGEEIRAAFDRAAILLTERLNAVIAALSGGTREEGLAALPYENGLSLGEALDDLARSGEELEELIARFSSYEEDILSLRSMLTLFESVRTLAENSVQRTEKQGIYAHDYNSATGMKRENILSYSPNVSAKIWSIVQRNGEGYILAKTPTHSDHVATKGYTDSSFIRSPISVGVKVEGKSSFTDYTEGMTVRYGNGGVMTAASGMKTVGGIDYFDAGFTCTIYANTRNAYVTDAYHGEYPLAYDAASGLYRLNYTQKSYNPSEDTSHTSFYLNLPIDGEAYVVAASYVDQTTAVLDANRLLTLSGIGIKRVSLPTLTASEESRIIAKEGVSLAFEADLPVRITGATLTHGKLMAETDAITEVCVRYGNGALLLDVKRYREVGA